MEEVGEVRLRDFEIMPRRHLHLRQTVAGGMNESRRPEIGIRRATVHDEPLHLVEPRRALRREVAVRARDAAALPEPWL